MKKYVFVSVLVTAMAALAGCTSQQLVDEAFVDDTPALIDDEFVSLLEQARWGDGQAFLKLADCYRDGKGVDRDFMGMLCMASQADEFGGINRMEDYLHEMPEGSDFRLIFEAIGRFENNKIEEAQSLCEQMLTDGSADGYTVQGIMAIESGDTIGGRRLIEQAATEGSSFAKFLLCFQEWGASKTMDMERLKTLSEEMPIVNLILAKEYMGWEDEGMKDEHLAAHYFLKADEKACLNKRGAKWLLYYHRNVSSLPLSGRDIQRIQILAGETSGVNRD
jgi:hypothetical protein